ncbi:MAG: hypothetical protein R3E79_47390 [Caldilineaceae bacterium]
MALGFRGRLNGIEAAGVPVVRIIYITAEQSADRAKRLVVLFRLRVKRRLWGQKVWRKTVAKAPRNELPLKSSKRIGDGVNGKKKRMWCGEGDGGAGDRGAGFVDIVYTVDMMTSIGYDKDATCFIRVRIGKENISNGNYGNN